MRHKALSLIAELLAVGALAYPVLAYPSMLAPLAARLGLGAETLGLGIASLMALLVLVDRSWAAYVVLAVLAGYSSALTRKARYAEALVASLVASSILVTLSLRWRVRSRSGAVTRTRCDTECLLLNAGGLVLTYASLGLATYYGSLWGFSLYKYALSRPESIGEPVAVVWRLLASSPTMRLLVALALIALFYYTLSRLVAPVVYALTASPSALRKQIEEMERIEAREVLAKRKWYHRMLGSSLLLTGFVTESAIAFMVFTLLVILLGGSLAGATRYLLGLISLALGYLFAKNTMRLIGAPRKTWTRILVLALGCLAVLVLYVSLTEPAGLSKALEVLSSPFTGQQPPFFRRDPGLGLELATYEGYIYKISRLVEHIARLIVEFFWG